MNDELNNYNNIIKKEKDLIELINSPDIFNDKDAQEAILAFLMEHGRQIKAVINDFVDNSNELDPMLMILDDDMALGIE